MKQLRDPFLVKRWRVSWTDNFTKVRVSDVFTARTKAAAVAVAKRAHPNSKHFKVGSYHGGVEIPAYHASSAHVAPRCVTPTCGRRPSGRPS